MEVPETEEIVDLRTGAVVTVPCFLFEREVDYPNTWFEKHHQEKPTITIGYRTANLNEMIKFIATQKAEEFQVEFVKSLLVKYMRTITATLEEDWVTESITIGRRGDEISPASLLNITENHTDWEGYISETPVDPEVIIGSLLMIYRVKRLTQEKSGEDIYTLSERFTRAFGKPPFFYLSLARIIPNFCNFIEYRKIVAAYDMFFHRFPNHHQAKLRLGTLTSRWKDCTALKTLYELSKLLSINSIPDFLTWAWCKSIRTDAERILKHPLPNSTKEHCYFFYMSDMGLVFRSAYSVTANPAMHFFCQTIYAAMGNLRGIKACMVHPPMVHNIIDNALIVAFAHKSDYPKLANNEAQSSQAETTNTDAKSVAIKKGRPRPDDKDPVSWFSYTKLNGNDLGDDYKTFKRYVKSLCGGARPGTVGSFLHSFL